MWLVLRVKGTVLQSITAAAAATPATAAAAATATAIATPNPIVGLTIMKAFGNQSSAMC
jgi:hypothetical protein